MVSAVYDESSFDFDFSVNSNSRIYSQTRNISSFKWCGIHFDTVTKKISRKFESCFLERCLSGLVRSFIRAMKSEKTIMRNCSISKGGELV